MQRTSLDRDDPQPARRAAVKSQAALTALGILGTGIFLVDTVTDREIAVAVFYVVVVLLSLRAFDRRGVVLVAVSCAALTLVSYFLNRSGSPQSGLVNCVISLSAIAVTAYLALRMTTAHAEAQDARAQLAHSSRVTALGELAASLAHEVNQPLTAIVTSGNACARWLSMDVPNVQRAAQAVQRIVDDANRASAIVGRVRQLAKNAPPREEYVNVNDTIRDVLDLTAHELDASNVEIVATLADDLPHVPLDRVQVQQVLLNLILNSVEAMKTIADSVRRLDVSSARCRDGSVCVSVRDTGRGLSPGEFERVFDAFYTTKSGGMGMGLAISRSIIEAHRGRIWVTPNERSGATFHFTLPSNGAHV